MMFQHHRRKGETVRIPWSTNDGNGGSITRSTNGTLEAYADGTGTAITAGITDTEDHGTDVGTHIAEIDTSNDAYVSGKFYLLKVVGAVIDGQTVNAWLGGFSLEDDYMRNNDAYG